MALLSILRYPDERLHTAAEPVQSVNDEIRRLIEDMADTMYAAPGVGLAATQVDVHKQIIVIDVSEAHDSLLVLVNPEILERRGTSELEEGCLSVPGIYDGVERPAFPRAVRAQDVDLASELREHRLDPPRQVEVAVPRPRLARTGADHRRGVRGDQGEDRQLRFLSVHR